MRDRAALHARIIVGRIKESSADPREAEQFLQLLIAELKQAVVLRDIHCDQDDQGHHDIDETMVRA